MLCAEVSLVKQDEDAAEAVTLHCRSWTCPICLPRRQAQLAGLGVSGRPNKFITLTASPDVGSSPTDRARLLVDAWRQVVKRACKHYGYKQIPYLCVFEATKNGEPHLHILARCNWIDQGWLAEQMQELNGAPICWIEQVKSQKRCARYVSKYCGKQPHHFGTLKRYWCTRSWPIDHWEKPDPPITVRGAWDQDSRSLDELETYWNSTGWTAWLKDGHLWGHGHDPPY